MEGIEEKPEVIFEGHSFALDELDSESEAEKSSEESGESDND